MILTEYTSAKVFRDRIEQTLLRRETVYGLTLGICHALVTDPLRYGSQPFLATVEDGAGLAVVTLMTPPHKLQLCAADDCDAEALRLIAARLHEDDWPVPAVLAPEPLARRFATTWCELTGASFEVGMRQRIHELRSVTDLPHPPGTMVQAADADIALAAEWIQAFHEEAMHGVEPPPRDGQAADMVQEGRLFFWDDDGKRSMAARTRPTANGESIGAVYTPPEHRRNGYASAVVAGLSQRILDDGKSFCTLFTDLSNPTSNHIYREIGYRPVADLVDLHFEGSTDCTIM